MNIQFNEEYLKDKYSRKKFLLEVGRVDPVVNNGSQFWRMGELTFEECLILIIMYYREVYDDIMEEKIREFQGNIFTWGEDKK